MIPAGAVSLRALQEALAGQYVLQGELGRGGMAIVYLAYEAALDRPVALKLLPPAAADTRWRELFLREARAAARLSHPNIVPIYHVDRVREFVYFTMPYVDGETLADRVKSDGPLSVGDTIRVIEEVADAAAYAHRQGVIHRDLKPDNIILERSSGRAMVMDFGIAQREAHPNADPADYLEGTIAFMSPERVLGRPEDGRSDVYSLGATAYYAVTGRPPFDHARPEEILRQHVLRPAPPLRVSGQDGDTTLAQVVERCLAKEPDGRFQTADELAEALAQAPELRGETPVPLRAFVARSRHIARSAGGLSVIAVVSAYALIKGIFAGDSSVALPAAAVAALLVAVPLLVMLTAVRRVLEAGYRLEDMVAALREDVARAREDLEFQHGKKATRRGRTLRRVAYAGLGLTGLATAWLALAPGGADVALAAMATGLVTALGAGAAGQVRARPRRQRLAGSFWLRFWNGRLGTWTLRLAGLGVRPPAARDPLLQVPQMLHLMDSEIGRIHAWIQRDDTFRTDELRLVTLRLEGNLTALEALRARLEAAAPGASVSSSLTTDLAAAQAICQMVQMLIDANREVEGIPRKRTLEGPE